MHAAQIKIGEVRGQLKDLARQQRAGEFAHQNYIRGEMKLKKLATTCDYDIDQFYLFENRAISTTQNFMDFAAISVEIKIGGDSTSEKD